jgi:hypothetical protein
MEMDIATQGMDHVPKVLSFSENLLEKSSRLTET